MSAALVLRLAVGSALLAAGLTAQTTALTIVNTSFPPGNSGQNYSQALQASGGTSPYTWSSSGQLPPGLTVFAVGVLSGIPTAGGTFNTTLTVTDSRGATSSRTFAIIIGGTGVRLAVTTASLPTGKVGQTYSQSLTATGGTPPYQWTATQALPLALTLDAGGTLSGLPLNAGSFSIPVQVTDSVKNTATATLALIVTAPPLTITTLAPIFGGTVGQDYVQTFRASGGTQPYNWSITSGSAGGLTLESGTGNLRGTPQAAGTFTFTVQVSDQAGVTASETFSLVVSAPALSLTAGSALPAGAVGVSYSQRLPLVVTGGTQPYTWSLASGSTAPPGLTFAASGLTLTGTPTAAGTFTFAIQVADSAGLTATRSLSLVINGAAISISTARQLPDGALNKPYSQTLAASGGQPPYTWTATGLPSGLVINPNTGLIGGTPAAAGSFALAITVTDSALASSQDRFTLNIALPPAPSATVSGLPSTVGPAGQFPVQVKLSEPFSVAITGQAILTFAPDVGPADRTIQFASGGTTANFTIPAGETSADVPIAVQTGTVSGTITLSLRLQAGGLDITSNPAPSITTQVERAAPVIRSVQVSRSGSTISFTITGFSTAREITQAAFAFNAAAGQTLQSSASSITIDVTSMFGNWFQDPNNSQYGSVFVLTQPFTVTGDVNAVLPSSVTMTNRFGSATFKIQ